VKLVAVPFGTHQSDGIALFFMIFGVKKDLKVLLLLCAIQGMNVQLTMKNGDKYEGLFHGANTVDLGVTLKLARKVMTKPDEKNTSNRVIPTFIVLAKDCMEIYATSVDFSGDKQSGDREGEGSLLVVLVFF
jgi:hypothetical protein